MKKLLSVILATILLLSLSACGKNVEKTTLSVNEVTHSVFYSPFYLAIELGFFEEEGISIELTNGGGSNVSMTAVISGQADIGLVGPETVVYVYNEGKEDHPVVFAKLTQRDGSFLISRNDEKNFSYKDLEGKEIIAGRKGGLPAMTLEYVLNQNGLFNGVNVTLNYDIAFNLQASAFESGTGDYTTLFEPTASDFCIAKKGYNIASIGKDSGEVPYTCFVATKSFIDKNPELLKGFVKALKRAKEFMDTHSSKEVAEILLPQFSGTTVTQLQNAVESYLEIDAWSDDMILSKESFDRLQNIMENAGELSQKADFSKVVYNDIAESVS